MRLCTINTGQLRTLRTRIAPFLLEEFNTYKDLLEVVPKKRSTIQINCTWLAGKLREIDAAVRASVISPIEDAKAKLTKVRLVVINPESESYSMEVKLHPGTTFESLSMDELKQAFQLFEMSVSTDDISSRDGVAELELTRKNVRLILDLSDVFGRLFASCCILYTFREPIEIHLSNLESEIQRMRNQFESWESNWKQTKEMPLLALFSRGYLLKLADLIGHNKAEDVVSILRSLLPSVAPEKIRKSIEQLIQRSPPITDNWLSTDELFQIFHQLHQVIQVAFREMDPELVKLPSFLVAFSQRIDVYFKNKAVVILNVLREHLMASSLAAYVSITHRPIEPTRLFFVTANTEREEVERFMTLWSVSDQNVDLFVMVHVENLSSPCAVAIREAIDRILPEQRTKLLLLAQRQQRVQSTKSLGVRLGLVCDRNLDMNSMNAEILRPFFSKLMHNTANLHFFTSKLPGCGKSQQVMHQALHKPGSSYYRLSVRTGSVKELLASLKTMEQPAGATAATFLHLDVAYSASLEFNDVLLSLLLYGALYDLKKVKLGFWAVPPNTSVAVEFASPSGVEDFPIIDYLGQHHVCECTRSSFTYNLAAMPQIRGQMVTVKTSDALIVAGKFLQLKEAGEQGLLQWQDLCKNPENMSNDPLPTTRTFELLGAAFLYLENQTAPTYSAMSAMASFLHRHVRAMVKSVWFTDSAQHLFEKKGLDRVFKMDIFKILLRAANDTVSRCWSISHGQKLVEMNWERRHNAMFLIGVDKDGQNVTGINVVGHDASALKEMFDPKLQPTLDQQSLKFSSLRGFSNLMKSREGSQIALNAIRSLLLLDGTAASIVKANQLDNPVNKSTPVIERLRQLIGENHGFNNNLRFLINIQNKFITSFLFCIGM